MVVTHCSEYSPFFVHLCVSRKNIYLPKNPLPSYNKQSNVRNETNSNFTNYLLINSVCI